MESETVINESSQPPIPDGRSELERWKSLRQEPGARLPAEAPAASAAPPVEVEAPAPVAETSEPELEAEAAPTEPAKPRTVSKRQQEINEHIRARVEAEARADELRRRLDALEQRTAPAPSAPPQTPAVDPNDPEPLLAQFDDLQEFTRQHSKWTYRQERHAELEAQRLAAAQAAMVEQQQTYVAQVAAAKAKYPDFDEVMNRPLPVALPPHVGAELYHSPVGQDVSYYLVQHPEELRALAQMNPREAVRTIAVLETKLTAASAPPAKPSNPSTPLAPPITPLAGGAAAVTKDASRMSLAEWKASRNKSA